MDSRGLYSADRISYSEILTFERCKRLHRYAYVNGWEPRRTSRAMADGRWMHLLLADYYAGRDYTTTHAATLAAELAECLFEEERDALRARAAVIGGVMDRYTQHYATDRERWEVVELDGEPIVERELTAPAMHGKHLTIHVDLVMRDLQDGTIWVWDHKTKQDFDRHMEARLDYDYQLSLYTSVLRALGIQVFGGLHNYIRMRVPTVPALNRDGSMSAVQVITDEATVRSFLATTGAREPKGGLDAYLERLPKDPFFRRYPTFRTSEELAATSHEIHEKIRERDTAVAMGLQTRSLTQTCIHCPFYRPCLTNLKGGDEELILAELYTKREAAATQEAVLPAEVA